MRPSLTTTRNASPEGLAFAVRLARYADAPRRHTLRAAIRARARAAADYAVCPCSGCRRILERAARAAARIADYIRPAAPLGRVLPDHWGGPIRARVALDWTASSVAGPYKTVAAGLVVSGLAPATVAEILQPARADAAHALALAQALPEHSEDAKRAYIAARALAADARHLSETLSRLADPVVRVAAAVQIARCETRPATRAEKRALRARKHREGLT